MVSRRNAHNHYDFTTSWMCWEWLFPGGINIRSSHPEFFSLICIIHNSLPSKSCLFFISSMHLLKESSNQYSTSIFLRTSSRLPTCQKSMPLSKQNKNELRNYIRKKAISKPSLGKETKSVMTREQSKATLQYLRSLPVWQRFLDHSNNNGIEIWALVITILHLQQTLSPYLQRIDV